MNGLSQASISSSSEERGIDALCRDSSEVVVYGFQHCCYENVSYYIQSMGHGKKAYLCTTIPSFPNSPWVSSDSSYMSPKSCKDMLASVVLENLRRSKEGKPIIPVLFCVDRSDKEPNLFEGLIHYDRVTYKEMRRALKLCCLEGELSELSEVARKTFLFVKVIIDNGYIVDLEEEPGRFEEMLIHNEALQAKFKKLEGKKKHQEFSVDSKEWRHQLLKRVRYYKLSHENPEEVKRRVSRQREIFKERMDLYQEKQKVSQTGTLAYDLFYDFLRIKNALQQRGQQPDLQRFKEMEKCLDAKLEESLGRELSSELKTVEGSSIEAIYERVEKKMKFCKEVNDQSVNTEMLLLERIEKLTEEETQVRFW